MALVGCALSRVSIANHLLYITFGVQSSAIHGLQRCMLWTGNKWKLGEELGARPICTRTASFVESIVRQHLDILRKAVGEGFVR